jgi:hypothetical protein
MTANNTETQVGAQYCDTEESKLVGAERCLEILFPHKESRPGLRSFREWQAKGFLPYRKIGRRTFFSPAECRAALDKRFTIQAR